MNILIADKLSGNTLEELKFLGCTVRFEPELATAELPERIGDAEILVVRSTKVTSETIDSASSLSLIIRAGAGVNTIDVDRASEQGVHVANCPGKNADAVAELAMGLLISADRRIAFQAEDLRRGRWDKSGYGRASGLKGRVLGIVGYGSVGRGLAVRAKAFGMSVIAWSRSLTPERAEAEGIVYCSTPLQLAKEADAVSIHLAVVPETVHLVDREFIDAMKSGAILVNTSRGEIVEHDALEWGIREKQLKVALDVYDPEPAAGESEFPHRDLAKLITGTHHIAASTEQASEAIADEVVNIVRSYLETGKPPNPVNAQRKSPATFGLVIRHYNYVGVLAGILATLRQEGINVEEMENSIFCGGKAAVCSLKLSARPQASVMQEINNSKNVIQATLMCQGRNPNPS